LLNAKLSVNQDMQRRVPSFSWFICNLQRCSSQSTTRSWLAHRRPVHVPVTATVESPVFAMMSLIANKTGCCHSPDSKDSFAPDPPTKAGRKGAIRRKEQTFSATARELPRRQDDARGPVSDSLPFQTHFEVTKDSNEWILQRR